jgi:hypothetical protein
MKKIIATIGLVAVLGLALAAPARLLAQASPDEKLFQEAKLLVFDKDWAAALAKLDALRERYASSPWAGQALFYRGECLSGLGGREREALESYKEYVRFEGAKPGLVEEAEGSIIDLALALYEKGDKPALREIEGRLDAPNKAIRYYAAYKLSLVPDRSEAAKAVPVLEKIVKTESDQELTDRARIALLRVSPESLRAVEDRHPDTHEPRMFHLRITKKGTKERVDLNFPWALADLALGAMSDDDKASLRAKGYDINKIMNDLSRSKGTILRIEGEDGSLIEIWID